MCTFHWTDSGKDLISFNHELETMKVTGRFACAGWFFPQELDLTGVQIEDADFTGANFQRGITFETTHFKGDAHFESAHFEGYSFAGAHFAGKVSFDGALLRNTNRGENGDLRFEGGNFKGTVFAGESSFIGTSFQGTAFDDARFGERASFDTARFQSGREASFRNSIFSESVSFSRATFEVRATFDKASFCGEVIFSPCSLRAASFREATFGGPAIFGRTKLDRAYFDDSNECVDFEKAIFSEEARFVGLVSECAVSFKNARFKHATFANATFRAPVSFDYAEIESEADFTGASFDAAPTFEATVFRGPVLFEQVEFGEKTTLDRTQFGPDCSFALTDVGSLWFRESQMGGVRLARAYKTAEAAYEGIVWGRQQSGFFLRALLPRVIWEDRHARETGIVRDFWSARAVYAQLRRSLEEHKDLAGADLFAAQELEMRRLVKGRVHFTRTGGMWPWLRQNVLSFEALYLYLSGYGRSSALALFWLAVAIFGLFPILYAALGIRLDDSVQVSLRWWEAGPPVVGELWARSLATAGLVPDPIRQTWSVQMTQIAERILGPFLGFLFAFTVRRHFRR